MYESIKESIYEEFIKNKDKKAAILWSGGPYSSFLWYIAYIHLSLKLPVIFIDTGNLPPLLYAHIAKVRDTFKLDLTIISGSLEEVILEQKKKYDILYSGKPITNGTAIIPGILESWNFIKSVDMPFFNDTKSKVLG